MRAATASWASGPAAETVTCWPLVAPRPITPSTLLASAVWLPAVTDTAEANPDWAIDLCDEVIGTWRGEEGNVAAMTLVNEPGTRSWGELLTTAARARGAAGAVADGIVRDVRGGAPEFESGLGCDRLHVRDTAHAVRAKNLLSLGHGLIETLKARFVNANFRKAKRTAGDPLLSVGIRYR